MKTKRTLAVDRVVQKFSAVLVLALALPVTGWAQDYKGAAAVLSAAAGSSAKPAETPKKDASAQLRDDLKAFAQNATNLAPANAAQQWLQLVDRARKMQKQARMGTFGGPVQAEDLLGVLPPPAAWPALSVAVAARPAAKKGEELPETGLHLLAAALTGNVGARNREISNLQAQAKSAGPMGMYSYQNALNQLGQAMLNSAEDPDAILKSLGYQLQSYGREQQQLEVPNLVSLIGREKAEAFLRKALVTPNLTLQFAQANETSRLAQKLAFELMDQLKTAQWQLVNSLDAVALYEAMDKRFPAPTNAIAALTGVAGPAPDMSQFNEGLNNGRETAQVYYMLGLISNGRTAEAVAVASKLKGQNSEYLFEGAFKSMMDAGYGTALDDFLYKLLSQDGSLPFWDEYVEVSASAGFTGRMLDLIRTNVANADLSDQKKAGLHQLLFKGLLADDDVEGAMAEARVMMKLTPETPNELDNGRSYNPGQLGVMMARLGLLVQKPELVEEGVAAAKKWLARAPDEAAAQNADYNSLTTDVNTVVALAQLLWDAKRGPEAESVLTDALAKAVQAGKQQRQRFTDYGAGLSQAVLTELVKLYYRAGRTDDVVQLLKTSPDWAAQDLSEVSEHSQMEELNVVWMHTGVSPLPVPFMAASALLAQGDKEDARKINEAVLARYPGLDRGYELLLALDGTGAIPELDKLFARDQFEERPLIWKAHLLRQENKLDEAEKTIRQAVSIDPSDGEEGRGDRMRAYSELADILDARGNAKDAATYREVVKSIRMSEDADQLYQAGLLKRAITLYEQALTHFSDAYCIQSRLAIQLAALGRNVEAEEHYRRAYELMPDSFGRVESHCFGCEKAFDGDHAQNIAEKVFTQLVAERADKPQVHYLLGYLREEQERYTDALTNFLAATRLDPDYLNAWVKAQEASGQTLLTPKERDEIAFNIVRLDPLQRHNDRPDFGHVTDLTGLWNAVAAAAGRQIPAATNLFALEASKEAMLKKQSSATSDEEKMQEQEQQEMMEQMQERNSSMKPGGAIAETPYVRVAGELIFTSNPMDDFQ